MTEKQRMQLLQLNHPYFEPIDLPFNLPTRFYGAMLVVWQLKPNLQRRFPLYLMRRRDYLNYLAWCVAIGRRECEILCEIPAWDEELYEPAKVPKLAFDRWHGCINVALYLIGLHKARYWQWQNLSSTLLRHRTCRWFFRSGRSLLKLECIKNWQLAAMKQRFGSIDSFEKALIKRKEDLHAKAPHDLSRIASVWDESEPFTLDDNVLWGVYFRCLLCFVIPVWLNVGFGWWNKLQASQRQKASYSQNRLVEQIPIRKQKFFTCLDQFDALPFGVNLYGYAKGELGIGEDVRMMALAMEAASIPFCVINVPLPDSVSQKDSSISHWVVAKPKYSINLFCMTGVEMCRLVSEQGIFNTLLGKYNIGLWPWELPKWPTPLHHTWNLVDELWGISEFVSQAYSEAPLPVNTIPLPVELGEVSDLSRAELKLPESAYLFVFSFDINSTITRKNPIATINSFREAFPTEAATEVGLVLKVSHLNEPSTQWSEIEKAIDGDRRIHVIAKEMRKPDVLGLYDCCDCYVSLHRSEGFGRALAESQLLGLGLITTGYSGNLDFCKDEITRLVSYKKLELSDSDYFFGVGQQWADVDVDDAASAMRDMFENRITKNICYPSISRFDSSYCGSVIAEYLEPLNMAS